MRLETKWTVSRARETEGYNVCSLYADGKLVARCNGGGYDMVGTVLGTFIEQAFADRLRALKPEDMPEQSHWERDRKPGRYCENDKCAKSLTAQLLALRAGQAEPSSGDLYAIPQGQCEPHQNAPCPQCGGNTRADYHAGRRVDDGRYFYGLRFHDPNYDASKAVIGKDCDDRTLSGGNGLTVGEAEAQHISFGLERVQAQYTASSPHATERHTVPSIDGACGRSSVENIMRAIGLSLQQERTSQRSRNDAWELIDGRKE